MNEDRFSTAGARNAADDFLSALSDRGVDYLFGNAGTDFPSIIEGFAKAAAGDGSAPTPVTVPHENLAVSMAHGYYLAAGKPAAVMLHVNVGTANAICALTNAARDNVPVLLTAGRTPILEDGVMGSRSVYIHWGQEMYDQGGMLRELVKWDYELRRPEQVAAVVDRALTVAMSEPRGPVYLTLPREALAADSAIVDSPHLPPATPAAPAAEAVAQAADWIAEAERVLLITAAYGQDPAAVPPLADMAERFGVGVVAYRPRYMTMPNTHDCMIGYEPGPVLPEADLILVLDCDVPWIPKLHKRNPDARVVQIGADPVFSRYPMRSFASDLSITGNSRITVEALSSALADRVGKAETKLSARRDWIAEKRAAFTEMVEKGRESAKTEPGLSAATVADAIDAHRTAEDILVTETVFPAARVTLSEPGTYFGNSPAGGLGWGLGASLGLKLGHKSAGRDRRVFAVIGDGAYMFGNPTPAHFVAASLELPVITIILNNRMWGAVRRATLSLYPDGAAAKSNQAPLTLLEPSPAYEAVAEAGGAWGARVETRDELDAALKEAIRVTDEEKRGALINVMIDYSDQAALADSRR